VHVLISIDDTDDVDSRGTGEVAELLADGLVAAGLVLGRGRVSRHQLLIHPDIAYTSHNSAMCFTVETARDRDGGDDPLAAVVAWCREGLEAESEAAADPGLCVAAPALLADPDALIAFGRSAKERVRTKDEAYAAAAAMGVHLSEHGGTGIGVIGALAGAGLRLSGDDGRFRGKTRIEANGGVLTVAALRGYGADSVRSYADGVVGEAALGDDEQVAVGAAQAKLVLLGGEAVLLVTPCQDGPAPWELVPHSALKAF
jgi:hypothetical protein